MSARHSSHGQCAYVEYDSISSVYICHAILANKPHMMFTVTSSAYDLTSVKDRLRGGSRVFTATTEYCSNLDIDISSNRRNILKSSSEKFRIATSIISSSSTLDGKGVPTKALHQGFSDQAVARASSRTAGSASGGLEKSHQLGATRAIGNFAHQEYARYHLLRQDKHHALHTP